MMQDNYIFRILVYGTGNWCCKLLYNLPQNVEIIAFIETVPKVSWKYGLKVISVKEIKNYYPRIDCLLIAVENNNEIRNIINSSGYQDKTYYMHINNSEVSLEKAVNKECCSLSEMFTVNNLIVRKMADLTRHITVENIEVLKYMVFPFSKEQIIAMVCLPLSLVNYNKENELLDNINRFCKSDNNVNPFDAIRLLFLWMNLDKTLSGAIGDVAELGVYKGATAAVFAKYCDKYGRKLFLFDTFEGFSSNDLVGIDSNQYFDFSIDSLETVKRQIGYSHLVYFKKGRFPDSIDDECDRQYAFVHIDCDLYVPIKKALNFFGDRLTKNGMIVVHDYGSGCWNGATKAVNEFVEHCGWNMVLIPDISGSIVLQKNSN